MNNSNATHHFISDYDTFPSNTKFTHFPLSQYKFAKEIRGQFLNVHLTYVDNPLKFFSIEEPFIPNGCSNDDNPRVKTSVTSFHNNCTIAMNGGFWNTTNGKCFGNIISSGHFVQIHHRQNANFGITKHGTLITGYIPSSRIKNKNDPMYNLVSGVIWLVRGGYSYVSKSKEIEDMSREDTGDDFVTVLSARTAIGHDYMGRVVIMQVDGKSWQRGLDLYDMADLLIEFGVVNAINLDGGGSATYTYNNVVVNLPSDTCNSDERFNCERAVTTIVCLKGSIKNVE